MRVGVKMWLRSEVRVGVSMWLRRGILEGEEEEELPIDNGARDN